MGRAPWMSHTQTSKLTRMNIYVVKTLLLFYPMFNVPIFQPGTNKSDHFRMNLSNLRGFVKKIFETILVIMMNTIFFK